MTTATTIDTSNHEKTTDIIILAAGKGSRMRSAQPKVMHRIGGNMLSIKLTCYKARITK